MAPPLMVGAAMMSLATQEAYMQAQPRQLSLEPLSMGQLPPNYCTYNFGNSSFNLLPLRLDVGQMWLVLVHELSSGGNIAGARGRNYMWPTCRRRRKRNNKIVIEMCVARDRRKLIISAPSRMNRPLYACRYLEDDRNNEGSQNYTYIFNVCDDVFFPKWFPNTGDCATTYPGPGQYPSQPNTGNASAYQLSNFPVPNGDKCHKLGGSLRKDPTQMTWGLYDTANPATGVVVQFKGGDACPGTFPARTRSMRLWLNCYNDEGAIPGKETVLESETCTYDIFVNSALGCPAECPRVPTADGSKSYICSRHGVVSDR